jgi:aspartate aminotransferase-like enzyme
VTEATLRAMGQPQVGHRTPEFSELFASVTKGIEALLGLMTSLYKYGRRHLKLLTKTENMAAPNALQRS